ncbi:unnamed protein product, partial [Nesidiocoris tenuis]
MDFFNKFQRPGFLDLIIKKFAVAVGSDEFLHHENGGASPRGRGGRLYTAKGAFVSPVDHRPKNVLERSHNTDFGSNRVGGTLDILKSRSPPRTRRGSYLRFTALGKDANVTRRWPMHMRTHCCNSYGFHYFPIIEFDTYTRMEGMERTRDDGSEEGKSKKRARAPVLNEPLDPPEQTLEERKGPLNQPSVPFGFLSPSVQQYLELGKSIPGRSAYELGDQSILTILAIGFSMETIEVPSNGLLRHPRPTGNQINIGGIRAGKTLYVHSSNILLLGAACMEKDEYLKLSDHGRLVSRDLLSQGRNETLLEWLRRRDIFSHSQVKRCCSSYDQVRNNDPRPNFVKLPTARRCCRSCVTASRHRLRRVPVVTAEDNDHLQGGNRLTFLNPHYQASGTSVIRE